MAETDPLTSDEIVGFIRQHWMENIGANWDEADARAERGFAHMLQVGSIREWGFNDRGETLYEPCTVTSEAIVYVITKASDN